jgi:hypothetical protein
MSAFRGLAKSLGRAVTKNRTHSRAHRESQFFCGGGIDASPDLLLNRVPTPSHDWRAASPGITWHVVRGATEWVSTAQRRFELRRFASRCPGAPTIRSGIGDSLGRRRFDSARRSDWANAAALGHNSASTCSTICGQEGWHFANRFANWDISRLLGGHSLRHDSKFTAETGILGGSSPKWSPIALQTFRKLLVSSMGQGHGPTGYP